MIVNMSLSETNELEAPPRRAGWRERFAIVRRGALDMVYPPQCISCNVITGEPATLCATCWRDMPFITRPYCERLGTPFAVDLGGPLISPAAMADPPVAERQRAVARHDGAARDLVHRLKYNDRQELALAMGQMMAVAGSELLRDADILIPIPLHWTRLWQRRFNQAAALAHVIGQQSGLPVMPELLRRRKRTRRQVGLTRAERQDNLQGAFVVPTDVKENVRGKRILLVDDVATTGSTGNAAARILLRAGASHVDVLTFSRVVTPV
jgi:ComF family protein